MSLTQSPQGSTADGTRVTPRPPWALILLALTANFWRFGYDYGDGDHDELVPSAMALLDPGLFERDWLIQHVSNEVNVRTAFVHLLAAGGALGSLPVAAAVLHAVVLVGTAYGIYLLAWTLLRDRLSAGLGTFVALAVTPAFTLGANRVAYPSLVPEGVGWALALPGVALFLQRRWIAAGVLLGVAAWFHLLVGLLPALALGLVALWRTAERAPGYGLIALVRFAGAFALASLPILVPVALQHLGGGASADDPGPFYVHAVFRNPFHHLFSAFPTGQHVRFWGLMAAGVAGLWSVERTGSLALRPEVVRLWLIIAGLCAVAVVFVEIVPVAFVAKLQLFKLTVLAGLVASLLAGGLAAISLRHAERRLPNGARNGLVRLVPLARRAALPLAVALAAAVLGAALAGAGRPATLIGPSQHAATPLAEVESWARTSTARDALFAILPSIGSFRTSAERAVVANWHAFVFDDAAMQVWYERLQAVAPIHSPPPALDRKPLLDSAYAAQGANDWRMLQARYDIDYVLVRARSQPLPFPVAFRNEAWIVHSMPPSPIGRGRGRL